MAYLINRNPSGRIICLHALVQYLNNAFGDKEFTLNDMKFDENSEFNIHQTCTLLHTYPSIPFPVCPYLENPLSKAKCYLTQSIQEDTQKSKSVSDAFNALEGLCLVERTKNGGKLTNSGIEFASLDYRAEEILPLIKKGLLSYGPFIGLLYEFSKSRTDIISRSSVSLGYPVTNETIKIGGRITRLSTGSQKDTITRTRSVLFIWAITGGFALPSDMKIPNDIKLWHVEVLNYILSKKWTVNSFKIFLDRNYFDSRPYVDNPLSYNSMTKSTKALRERHQENERSLSLKYEHIFKNRRFAIVYLLSKCSDNNKSLNFSKLLKELLMYPKLFVINKSDFQRVLDTELPIAHIAGIPFVAHRDKLEPQTRLNMKKLSDGAPSSLIKILDSIYEKVCD